MLNGPIEEALVLVQLEEHEQAEVDFHPHCHHWKLELETCQGKLEGEKGTIVELGLQAKYGTPAKLGSQAKRFSSNLTSLLMIISCEWG